MPFTMIRDDITRVHADAIVNAANIRLSMGGGVCGAIFRAAGEEAMQAACNALSPISTGQAVATPAFNLSARYVLHAAGPVYDANSPEESERLLRAAYQSALQLAHSLGCERVAFPLISSGIYGYPKAAALVAARETIEAFLEDHDMDVVLLVFDRQAVQVGDQLMGDIARYIDQRYVDLHTDRTRRHRHDYVGHESLSLDQVLSPAPLPAQDQGAPVFELDTSFAARLFEHIDRKGLTDAQVYKRANIDRKLFSKIRSIMGYMPGKRTVIALALALELPLEDVSDLLARAGYALSTSQRADVIVEYFIMTGTYDILTINDVLFRYGQPLLGA